MCVKDKLIEAGNKNTPDWVPKTLFMLSLIVFSILYGMAAVKHNLFPYTVFAKTEEVTDTVMQRLLSLSWLNTRTDVTENVTRFASDQVRPGLTKVVSMEGEGGLAVKVIDLDANPIQYYDIEWSDVWPEVPSHLLPEEVPRARPGTHVHGAEIMKNGDVVFNFEHLSLVRMNACSEVVWRLPYRTHHSVFVDEKDNLWVSAQKNIKQGHHPDMPFIRAPYVEPFILEVSPEGEILKEKSVLDLLIENDQKGALLNASIANEVLQVSGDFLHLNDVEVFPSTMETGFFSYGDVMISLRNINSIFVFDSSWKLKYKIAYDFVRQHDPDFIDGNHIAIYDNYNIAEREKGPQSRILIHDARDGSTDEVFSGTDEEPFFSSIMGKQQWLDNGNLLISESRFGRAIEIGESGEIVWEYYNLIDEGWLGVVEEAERLRPDMDADFFAEARNRCTDSAN